MTSAVAIATVLITGAPPAPDETVTFEMTGPAIAAGVLALPDPVTVALASDGTGTANLLPSPPATSYRVTVRDRYNRVAVVGYAIVPASNCALVDVLVLAPPLTVNGRDLWNGYPGLTGYALGVRNAAGGFLSFLSSLATAVRSWALPDHSGTILVDTQFVDLETPVGAINGINAAFTLTSPPAPVASCIGYVRQGGGGSFLPLMSGVDFALAGNVVTLAAPPDAGSQLLFSYRR